MGEDFKQGAPNVFMTFGLGALLLLSLLFPFSVFSLFPEAVAAQPEVPALGEIWIPITATVVFALHSIGSLMIAIGRWPVSFRAKNNIEADRCFYELLAEANDRIWALVSENRQALQFTRGLIGIFQVHLIIIFVDISEKIFGMASTLRYDLTYAPILVIGLICALVNSSKLDLDLELIFLKVQRAKISVRNHSSVGHAQSEEINSP